MNKVGHFAVNEVGHFPVNKVGPFDGILHLNNAFIRRLFKLVLANPFLHNDLLFDEFEGAATNNFKLIKTENEFRQICSLFLDKCPKCGDFHRHSLSSIYPVMSSESQMKLSIEINNRLRSSFDPKLFYLAALHDIIDYKLFFTQYLREFQRPKKLEQETFFLNGEIKLRRLNELMNIVFKMNARLPLNFVKSFKGLSDYYDWLLDMKNFDYRKFNPLWILQYATLHYLQRIFSIEQAKIEVRKYLKVNNQPTLAYYYAQHVK